MLELLTKDEKFENLAIDFINKFPYQEEPYCSRNWGHRWHSFCSYHGKLKPAIAHFLIKNFTDEKDNILDPLGGVGTIALEAILQGRNAVSNDLSELAYVITKAKIEKTNYEDIFKVVENLSAYIENNKTKELENHLYDNFGLNGKIPEYFEKNTYSEILSARKYFKNKKLQDLSPAECVVFASFLHVLHGNRPYALSRNSHPLTPYAPTGEFIYKNVIEHIVDKINLTYKNNFFNEYNGIGKSILGNYMQLSNIYNNYFDAIITSPPFLSSLKFYSQNWMRLWLSGWEPEDYTNANMRFLEGQQKKDINIYDSFFEMSYNVLKSNGRIILHLGKTEKYDMADLLSSIAKKYFVEVYRGDESVKNIEKHGIKDKGGTTHHQYLFLIKR